MSLISRRKRELTVTYVNLSSSYFRKSTFPVQIYRFIPNFGPHPPPHLRMFCVRVYYFIVCCGFVRMGFSFQVIIIV
jgi:hypothetical protein